MSNVEGSNQMNDGWDSKDLSIENEAEAIIKQENKKRRQELKLSCLSMAHHPDKTPADIVEAAKAFYNFVRT